VASFGEELRRERELREISLREVSEATKINVRHLEAMERNDFAHLPGGLFNKGFVRAYCEFIGIDAEAMVNAYLLEASAQQQTTAPHAEPVVLRERRPARRLRPVTPVVTVGGQRALWLGLAAAALLAMLGMLWLASLADAGDPAAAGAASPAAKPAAGVTR
jgi:cytoskeletal protein RodZ